MPNEKDISPQQFISIVTAVLAKYEQAYQGSLEVYLLSLWVLVEKYQNQPPSYALFSKMIGEAFETPSFPFDDRWLSFNESISQEYQGDPNIKEWLLGRWSTDKGLNDFEVLRRTLLFQIVDIHQMAEKQLKDPYGYFGLNSPSGARWYNFDVFTYWECAISAMDVRVSPDWDSPTPLTRSNWEMMAELLTLGRLYE